jgi:hypothetical protein
MGKGDAPVGLAAAVLLGLLGVRVDEAMLAEELWDVLDLLVGLGRVVAVVELVGAGHLGDDVSSRRRLWHGRQATR